MEDQKDVPIDPLAPLRGAVAVSSAEAKALPPQIVPDEVTAPAASEA